MCGMFIIGTHSLTPRSHSLGTIASSQILIYFLPISLSFSAVILCWLYVVSMMAAARVFDFCS